MGLLLFIAVSTLFWSNYAMAQLVLFSAVTGTVIHQGSPVAGAKIHQTARWGFNDKTFEQSTVTDANGEFSLPALTTRSLLAGTGFFQPVVHQALKIHHQGQTFDAWFFTKHDYESNSELARPIQLLCDLDNEKKHSGKVFGICRISD